MSNGVYHVSGSLYDNTSASCGSPHAIKITLGTIAGAVAGGCEFNSLAADNQFGSLLSSDAGVGISTAVGVCLALAIGYGALRLTTPKNENVDNEEERTLASYD